MEKGTLEGFFNYFRFGNLSKLWSLDLQFKTLFLNANLIAIKRWALALGVCLFAFNSHAANRCTDVLRQPLEVAREIEIPRSAALTELLIPDHDQISRLIPKIRRLDFFDEYFPGLPKSEWENQLWSTATNEVKEAVFHEIGKDVNYAKDRTLPMFTISGKFKSLQGYGGSQRVRKVDASDILLPRVEYANGPSTRGAEYLELHFRGKDPLELDSQIRNFFELLHGLKSPRLNGNRNSQDPIGDHNHIPARRPVDFINRLKAKGFSDVGIARVLKLYHSVVELNMMTSELAQFARAENDVLSELYSKLNQPPLISFLMRSKLPELEEFYLGVIRGERHNIDRYGEVGTTLKKNYVGARAGSTYSDQSLWGMELRFRNYDSSRYQQFISAEVKKTLDSQSFFSDQQIDHLRTVVSAPDFDKKMWFSLDVSENISELPTQNLRDKAKAAASRIEEVLSAQMEGRQLKLSAKHLIFFNWSNHPLLSHLTSEIQTTQERYFDEIIKNGASDVYTLAFLKESGIYETLRQALSAEEAPQ